MRMPMPRCGLTNYAGSMSKLFEIQEAVARGVAEALDIEVTPSEQRALKARPIPDLRAYECYLRARVEYGRFTRAGAVQALEYVRQGLAVVGESALLTSGLGHAHFVLAHTIPGTMREQLAEAETHAKRALALHPELVGARTLTGLIHWKQQRIAPALREWTAALVLDPRMPTRWVGPLMGTRR